MRTTFYTLLVGLLSLLSQQASAQCPTPFCQDLNTSFMPDACMVEVWAKDFVSKIDMGTIPVEDYWVSFAEDSLVMNRVFMSEDGKKQDVSIWVAENPDGTGCKSRCDVTLTIRDNTGDCPEMEFAVCPIDPNPWCGWAVLTCSADNPDDLVASILDVRRNDIAPRGDDWAQPTLGGDTLNILNPPAWTMNNLGMVFGMARKVETGEIFMAASDIYAFDYAQLVRGGFVSVGFPPPTATGSAGPAGIYRTMFNTDANAITVNPIIFTNANQYLEAGEAIGGSFIPNFGNFDGTLTDPAGATNQFERFDSMGTTSGNGLGNITYDRRSNHLFASNLEDGKIYSINCSTNRITDVFDPFNAYDHAVDGPGIVQQSERVWGVAVRQCGETTELYFARSSSSTDEIDHLTPRVKSIYKVDILASGRFSQNDGDQAFVVSLEPGTQNKISDISFDISCNRMLLAERGHPHKARVYEFVNNGTSWVFEKPYYVGIYDEDAPQQPGFDIVGSSTGGGVTYGPSSSSTFYDAECDQVVWSTVHCGNPVNVPGRCNVYGLQGISVDGNDTLTSNATDIYVGLQADPGSSVLRLKNNLGDVDIFNCCCPDSPINPVATGTSAISGSITTPTGIAIKAAKVKISSREHEQVSTTNDRGSFVFDNLKMYQDYMITPEIPMDINVDGLSTLDIVMIQRHILGLSTFDDQYKVIAADVNGSGSVSAADMVALRKILLNGHSLEVPSWKTLLHSSVMDQDQILEYLEVNNLEKTITTGDFKVIKLGDVNYDNSNYGLANERSVNPSFGLIEKKQADGSTDLVLSRDIDMKGFQLELKGVSPNMKITSSLINIDNSNFVIEGNNLRLSWNGKASVSANEVLFTLNSTYTDLTLDQQYLKAEIYNSKYEVEKIDLIRSEELLGEISIFPNPFSTSTQVAFVSENSGTARVEVVNNQGQLVYSNTVDVNIGRNRLNLELNDNLQSGVFVLRIINGENVQNKKILKLK